MTDETATSFPASNASPPDIMLCGRRQFRMIRQEIAAGAAERAFAGRNWRRIKREARKARERIAP